MKIAGHINRMGSYRGNFEYVGGTIDEPNLVYYNADIINNSTDDLPASGLAPPDPVVRFNETRDAPIIKDASKYEMAIVRFTMNGVNRDLPLMLPNIQTGQPNPNLTNYSCAITFQQTWATPTGAQTFNIKPNPTYLIYQSETQNPVLAPTPAPPTVQQDLTSRYYWVYTYQHFMDLMNFTFQTAHQTAFTQFQAAYVGAGFPFASFAAFQDATQTPAIIYNEEARPLFSIYGDSDGFGARIEPFYDLTWNPATAYLLGAKVIYNGVPYVAIAAGAGNQPDISPAFWSVNATALPMTAPTLRLFFNTNMFGLFANFQNYYWNTLNIPAATIAGYPLSALGVVPEGYVNEIVFRNKFWTNIADYRIPPYANSLAPLGYVPVGQQKVYYVNTQDYKSVDTLWSPVGSIVFTSTLLPVKSEYTGVPNILGTGNLGDTRASTANAFTPIITDIALDQSVGGADDYRQFIYYAPNAEYRMADLNASKQEIRNIDIQVFWKHRLTGQLFPVSMFNLSSVSLKILFRKKGTI